MIKPIHGLKPFCDPASIASKFAGPGVPATNIINTYSDMYASSIMQKFRLVLVFLAGVRRYI